MAAKTRNRNKAIKQPPARNTLSEILSQPRIWQETEQHLADSGTLQHLADIFFTSQPLAVCGMWVKLLPVSPDRRSLDEILLHPGHSGPGQ